MAEVAISAGATRTTWMPHGVSPNRSASLMASRASFEAHKAPPKGDRESASHGADVDDPPLRLPDQRQVGLRHPHQPEQVDLNPRLALQQPHQQHPALAGAALAEGHGPQTQKRKATGTRVAIGRIGRHGRAGVQELARLLSRLHCQRLAFGGVHIQQHGGGRQCPRWSRPGVGSSSPMG